MSDSPFRTQLTALPHSLTRDRERFLQLLKHALKTASPRDTTAVLVIGLTQLHETSTLLGNTCRDQILTGISRLLHTAAVPEQGVLARIDVNQFAVLLPNLLASNNALSVAARIQRVLAEPFPVTLNDLTTTVDIPMSVGVAVAPTDATEASGLLRMAAIAMEKAAERDDRIATAGRETSPVTGRFEMLTLLRQALTHGGLIAYYQPKIDVATGRIRGVEALARWAHPDRGVLPPSEFIPLAESTGLITHVTYEVLHQALAQVNAWNQMGHLMTVAVNLSAICLHTPTLLDDVHRALVDHDVPPSQLCLEITETALIRDPDEAKQTLSALSDLGVGLSLDDFGTGYSSLAYLRHLPVNELKIDRSFVANITRDRTDTVVVRAAIDLGHNLGLSVAAEGVEDAPTLGALNDLGCDLAQGFHIARPMPGEAATDWIVAHA